MSKEQRRLTRFVTLAEAGEPPQQPDPTAVVVEYHEWHAADGDRPAVVGEPWSFVALATDVDQLVAAEPGDRTRLLQVDGPRYAFHARPVASGPALWADSSGTAAYDACGFRFALDDPPGDGWISGVATMEYDTYQVDDEAVVDASRQTLEVTQVHLVRFRHVSLPGQEPSILRGAVTGVEAVRSTSAVPLDHRPEGATFRIAVQLP